MKRRAALILGLLLVFQLALPPARAAERVYFTAVGSYVLPLSDNTMPFWSGGYVYIASSIFTGTGRESLGISQVLNSDQGRLVLYSGGRSLTYTLRQLRAGQRWRRLLPRGHPAERDGLRPRQHGVPVL